MNRNEILEKLATREISVEEAERLLREAAESKPRAEAQAEPATEAEAEHHEHDEHHEHHEHHEHREHHEHHERHEHHENGERHGGPRWLKIRVTEGGKVRVNISIPFGLVDWGMRMGRRVSWRHMPREWDEFWQAIRHGETGTLVEVENGDGGERVHVFVE